MFQIFTPVYYTNLDVYKRQRYTYEITNYPTQQDSPVQANLLVIDSKVVAGDVTSVAMGGFMHSFERPAISQNNDDNKLNETSGPSASDVLDSLNESDK